MLKVNNLIGFGGSFNPRTLTLLGVTDFTADVTSHTTGNIDIGSEPCILVAVAAFGSTTTFIDVTALSISGTGVNNFTRGVQGGAWESAIGWAYNTTGGNVTVTATTSTASGVNGAIALFKITNGGIGQFYATGAGTAGALTINTIANGFAIIGLSNSVTGDTLSVTGATEVYDQPMGASGRCLLAVIDPTTTATDVSVSITGETNQNSIVGMSFY